MTSSTCRFNKKAAVYSAIQQDKPEMNKGVQIVFLCLEPQIKWTHVGENKVNEEKMDGLNMSVAGNIFGNSAQNIRCPKLNSENSRIFFKKSTKYPENSYFGKFSEHVPKYTCKCNLKVFSRTWRIFVQNLLGFLEQLQYTPIPPVFRWICNLTLRG